VACSIRAAVAAAYLYGSGCPHGRLTNAAGKRAAAACGQAQVPGGGRPAAGVSRAVEGRRTLYLSSLFPEPTVKIFVPTSRAGLQNYTYYKGIWTTPRAVALLAVGPNPPQTDMCIRSQFMLFQS
jgi:hypothetical protein